MHLYVELKRSHIIPLCSVFAAVGDWLIKSVFPSNTCARPSFTLIVMPHHRLLLKQRKRVYNIIFCFQISSEPGFIQINCYLNRTAPDCWYTRNASIKKDSSIYIKNLLLSNKNYTVFSVMEDCS